jgi:hypothetical protein
MGDMAEGWAEFRAYKQAKKRSNLAASTSLLKHNNVPFVMHNGGIHLEIRLTAEVIDYWPSTGLWWIRSSRNKRRGVHKLINYLKGKTYATTQP